MKLETGVGNIERLIGGIGGADWGGELGGELRIRKRRLIIEEVGRGDVDGGGGRGPFGGGSGDIASFKGVPGFSGLP